MKNMFNLMKENLEAGNDIVLVSIIGDFGSAPRGSGAHMLVNHQGRIYGTIGGGAVEYQSEKLASEALISGKSQIKAFHLNQNDIEDIGMICGGDVMILFQYIDGGEETLIDFCQKTLAVLETDTNAWLIIELLAEDGWQMGLYCEDKGLYGLDIDEAKIKEKLSTNSYRLQLNGREFYTEPINQAGRVIIFGGGHVAQELVPVLAHVGFRCVVVDDREEFTRPTLFPGVKETINQNFADINAGLNINKNDYIVIMTRGHAADYEVLRQALDFELAYLGNIGSKAKIASIVRRLEADGALPERIATIHWPIGLDIMAETPAEIAISIAAELIMVRAQKAGMQPKWDHSWLE
jgi:xanthine dehydrogenase accessory factor